MILNQETSPQGDTESAAEGRDWPCISRAETRDTVKHISLLLKATLHQILALLVHQPPHIHTKHLAPNVSSAKVEKPRAKALRVIKH